MADRLRLPRVVRVTAVTLVLTIVAAVGVVRLVGPPSTSSVTPLLPQGIEVGERARGTYRVGEHTVLIAADGITISHPASPRAVWASPRARAFLVAATGTVDTPERRGMLRLSEHIEEVFGEQTVEGADVDTDGRLVITGLLGNEESDERLEYQVFVAPSDRRTGGLDIDVAVLEEVDRLSLISELDPGEQVHGLGAQFADFDLRGRAYPLIPRAQGVGRGAQPLSLLVDLVLGAAGAADTTGAPLPHVVTSAPRSLWVHGPDVVVADLRQDDRLAMTVWGEALEVSMAVGATPADHVLAHTSAEGVPRRVPEWLGTGLVLGVSEGASEVRDRLDLLAGAGVDVAAVWLSDWAGLRPVPFGDGPGLSGTVDAARYPDLVGLVEDLAHDDIRVLTTASPMLSPDAAHDGDRDLWQEAAETGWLVRDEDEQPYVVEVSGVRVGWVDLFDPDAQAWYARVLADEALGSGAAGLVALDGEGPPLDAVTAAGPVEDLRRAYPTRWAATTRRALELAGLGQDGLTVHTAVGPGTAGEAGILRAGDQLVDFSHTDGLASGLDGLLSGGVSGLTRSHVDIGASTTVALPGPLPDLLRSEELVVRSAELSAFTSMMRTAPGTRPDLGASITDEGVIGHLSALVGLFGALADERERLDRAFDSRALPLVRHPVLVVPEQPEVAYQPEVFFMGEDLFVAPVLEEGATEREVTLPIGSWVDIWTGEQVEVSRTTVEEATVEAPLGRPPAWARAGSAVAEDLDRWRQAS